MRASKKSAISELKFSKKMTPERMFFETLADVVHPGKLKGMNKDSFFATRLKIKDKLSKLVPFVMNLAQYDFEQYRTGRDLVVKPRQIGFSTKFQGDIYYQLATQERINAVTIADTAENTTTLVEIFNRFHENMPDDERPYRKGRYPHGIKFPLRDSLVYLGTAGSRRWGHGKTVHHVHGSEVAFWPDAKQTMDALLESVPTDPKNEFTSVVMESTPNGAGGYFYEEVQKAIRGDSQYKVHFYTWWWDDTYKLPLDRKEKIKYTTEEEELISRVYKEEGLRLSPEQIKWRRQKINDREEIFWQEYPEDIVTCFLLSGRPRFDLLKLQERINSQASDPIKVAMPIYDKGNEYYQVRIYTPPIKTRNYVIGADVAEGHIVTADGRTDFCAAVVRDRLTNEQVATVHGRFEPVEFAFILQRIGRLYNNALLGVERNNHGHAVLSTLIYGTGDGSVKPYRNLYLHWEDDRPGWPTNTKTRPLMIADLALEYNNPQHYKIRDKMIISEAMSFIVNAKGKAEASPGAFDDLVIADAIAGQLVNGLQSETEVVYNPVSIGDFSHW